MSDSCCLSAIANKGKKIPVSADWVKTVYVNDNTENAVQEFTYTRGIKEVKSETKWLVATHNVGVVAKGGFFRIFEVEVSYSFMHKTKNVVMTENEIYSSEEIKTTVTIPPGSTLTRWQLFTDVAGTKIGYSHFIDTLNDTFSPEQALPMSRATVEVRRPINYGQTRLRMKHSKRQEYMIVVHRKHWPAATLGSSSLYQFILCKDSRGIRIKTLNTTHPGYVFASSSDDEGIYFHKNCVPGHSHESNVDKQHWSISKEDPLYDGVEVSFRNVHNDRCAMCYHTCPETNIDCVTGLEEQWVLEVIDAEDYPTNNC